MLLSIGKDRKGSLRSDRGSDSTSDKASLASSAVTDISKSKLRRNSLVSNAKSFTIHENETTSIPVPPSQGVAKPSILKTHIIDHTNANDNTKTTNNTSTTTTDRATIVTNTNINTNTKTSSIVSVDNTTTSNTNDYATDIDKDVAEFLVNQEKAAKSIGRRIALVSSLLETLNAAKIKSSKGDTTTTTTTDNNNKEYHSHTMTKTKVYERSPFGTINAKGNMSSIDSHSNPDPFRAREFKTASNIEKDRGQKNEQVTTSSNTITTITTTTTTTTNTNTTNTTNTN